MKLQVKVWGTRLLSLAVLAFVVQHWGIPLYRQFFTQKKVEIFIPTAPAQEGKFVVSFHEIGDLSAESSVQVNSETNGKIITLVKEGAFIKPGDLIAELDTSDLEREVRDAKLGVQNEQSNVDRANTELRILMDANKTDLEQAQKQLDFDNNELSAVAQREVDLAENELAIAKDEQARVERLVTKKLLPGSQLDQEKASVRSRESALLGQKAVYDSKVLSVKKSELAFQLKKRECESKQKQNEADVQNAKFRLTMAQRALEDVERRMRNAVIKAPAAGMVVIAKNWGPNGRQPFKEGDNVNPRQTICELPDLSTMLVKVQLGESDAPRVHIGLPCLIRLDAVPDKMYHGTVKDIASLATEPMPWEVGSGKKNIQVTVAVKETDPRNLKPGMTADVEFICDTIAKAVYIPIESILRTKDKTCVYVKSGKKYLRRSITVGVHNDNDSVVTKGLSKGEVVTLRDPTKTLDAQEAGVVKPENMDDKGKTAPPIPDVTSKAGK